MKLVRALLIAAKGSRRSAIGGWARLCEAYFETVSRTYPHLVETNVRALGSATLDLLERGETDDPVILRSPYPPLGVEHLDQPAFRALQEVGAIRLDPAGDPVIEPSPGTLFRGLARLALPGVLLIDVVNAARERRGASPLTGSEFEALDRELFSAVKNAFRRAVGERWHGALNRGACLLGRSCGLPCLPLRGSQEFYEAGIDFYREQRSADALYVYSTTSGLVVPREFHGDEKKNRFRARYFLDGLLKGTAAPRVYQWERFRTARALAEGYEARPTDAEKEAYLRDSAAVLSRFTSAKEIGIFEVDHFDLWKEWNTLVGPNRQQVSVRSRELQGRIGHGVLYDVDTLNARLDLIRDAGVILNAAVAALGMGAPPAFAEFSPAIRFAAAAAAALPVVRDRIGPLASEPFFRKCEADRAAARVVKPVGKTLSRRKVRGVVEDLLQTGQGILALEKKR